MQADSTTNNILSSFVIHYDGLVDYVNHHFSNYNFASDVVHDICVKLIENPPTYNVETPLAYLRKVSINRAIDKSRHEQICFKYVNDVHTFDEVHYLDGASSLELSQKIDQLKVIIESLPSKQRQVFLLYQLHGMPQNDIASQMGISINMVTKHFNKAVASISLAWKQASI